MSDCTQSWLAAWLGVCGWEKRVDGGRGIGAWSDDGMIGKASGDRPTAGPTKSVQYPGVSWRSFWALQAEF
jgi:hypothetical protein